MSEPKTAEQVAALERSERRSRMRADDLNDAMVCAERMLVEGISKADVAKYIRSRRLWWTTLEGA